MNRDSFHFKLGNFECLVINDTVSEMNLDMLFPQIKGQQMEQLLNQYHVPAGDVMNAMCLLLRTGNHTVLIDTGWGVGEEPASGNLIPILKANGIPPAAIDTLIFSHAHPDHIGGITDVKGNPLFPAARHIMFQKEWEFWTSLPDLPQTAEEVKQKIHAYVRKNLIPLRDKFTLLDDKSEILPGIRFVWTPGHSPYHCILSITSGGERLLYLGDLVHHPIQIPRPDISPFPDFDAALARKTRTKIISQSAGTSDLIFVCHFPFPGLGRIITKDGLRFWQPLAIQNG